jgi:hypothetical protein
MILTFSNFTDSHPSPKDASKTVPPKAKGSDGHEYVLGKAAYEIVRDNLGSPLDVDTSTKQNGAFTNYSVTAARRAPRVADGVPTAGPESPIPDIQGARTVAPIKTAAIPASSLAPAFISDAARQRLIVKQSSLRAACDLVAKGYPADLKLIIELADTFVTWVFKEETYGLNDHEGGGDGRIDVTPPPSNSPAAKALESARNKAADIRADYHREDAVCPKCGRKEFLGPRAAFCKQAAGGCGWPHGDDEKDAISYGEWLARQQAATVPWK